MHDNGKDSYNYVINCGLSTVGFCIIKKQNEINKVKKLLAY